MAAGAIFACTNIASAQEGTGFPGNEAVRIVGGKRVVEAPPVIGSYRSFKPDSYSRPTQSGNRGGEVTMIEGPDGLMACEVPVLIKTACIPSDIGTVKRSRIWLVKLGGNWQQCNSRVAPMVCKPWVSTGKTVDAMLPMNKSSVE